METSIITVFFESHLYLFLFVVPFLSQLGIPLGTMFFILFAGSMTSNLTDLSILFLIALVGVILGDLLAYFFGKKIFNFKFFQYFLKKKSVNKIYLKTGNTLKEKGSLSVFVSRFLITGIGPMLNYIAGIQSFDFKKFVLFVVLGEILYVSEFLILGYVFKDTIDDVLRIISDFGLVLFLLLILYVIGINLFNKKEKVI